ncbi:MAG: flagellar biosynthesis repressor FlbT [Pseudomonadota bacterium]
MPLQIELKPNEKMLIGGAVIQNGDHRCELMVLNDVPILREKDIIAESEADTPAKRIYLAVQLMYIDGERLAEYHQLYWGLVKDVVAAAPSALSYVDEMSHCILDGRYYQALKVASRLIQYEKELIDHVSEPA